MINRQHWNKKSFVMSTNFHAINTDCGQFQATNMMSLNGELGRDGHTRLQGIISSVSRCQLHETQSPTPSPQPGTQLSFSGVYILLSHILLLFCFSQKSALLLLLKSMIFQARFKLCLQQEAFLDHWIDCSTLWFPRIFLSHMTLLEL